MLNTLEYLIKPLYSLTFINHTTVANWENSSLGLQVIGSNQMDLELVYFCKDFAGIIVHLSLFSLPSSLFSAWLLWTKSLFDMGTIKQSFDS